MCPSVRPSVCPPQAGIVPKWLLAYRKSCWSADIRMQLFYQQRLLTQPATSNQGLKWRVVRELLHSDKRKSYSSFEAGKLCSSFSLFLIDKLKCVTKVVGERSESMFYLTSTSHEPARQLYVNFGRHYYSRSHCSPIKVIAARRHVSLFTQAVS